MSLRKVINESNGSSVENMSHRAALVNKWGKLLEGVKGDYQRGVMAQLFENQSQHLLNEETTSANAAQYLKYTFPLLRRVNYGVTLA